MNAEYAKAADKLVLNSIAAIQPGQKPIDIIAGWRSKLILTADGKPRANVANAITAVRFAPEFHCVLAFRWAIDSQWICLEAMRAIALGFQMALSVVTSNWQGC